MKKLGLVLAMTIIVTLIMGVIPASQTLAAQPAHTLTGTETRITTDYADQYDPTISGNIIVYTDARGADLDVWSYNLSTGTEAPVTTADGDQQLSDVSDGLIAYTDYMKEDVLLFSTFDGTTVDLTGTADSNSVMPSIGQKLVVWQDDRDGNWEIYAKNLDTGEERRITNSPDRVDSMPRVDNGTIVWQSTVNNIGDIYSYDWATGQTRQITNTPSGDERNPDVSGKYVVYQGKRGGDYEIYLFDLTSGIETRLALPGDQYCSFSGSISGDYVCFEDLSSGTYHLKLWYLPTGEVFDLTSAPGGPPVTAGQFLSDIDGNRIVYTDDRNGQLDIYLYEFQLQNVAKSDQTISFSPLSDKTYGDADFTVIAKAASGLPVTFTASGNCTVTSDGSVHITGAGSCTITAHQSGNDSYNAAPDVSQTFTVVPAYLIARGIKANDKQYDSTTAATLDFSGAKLEGIIGTDDVSLNTSLYTANFASKDAGSGITVAITWLFIKGAQASDYMLTPPQYMTANISKAPMTITAVTNTKIYDTTTTAAAIPIVTGLKGKDSVSGLSETYNNANAGTGKTLSVTSYTVNDGKGGKNYIVTTVPNTTGVIKQASTNTTLTSSPNPASFWLGLLGDKVTFTATVSVIKPGAGTPTGVVSFYSGTRKLGNGTLDGTGKATYSTYTATLGGLLGLGQHPITAVYSGDNNFNGSTSNTVNQWVSLLTL